jgi:N-acetylglucosaminyldiphosphoundecaprenol N-acetyl-beta-D-mannosaminyltransferase
MNKISILGCKISTVSSYQESYDIIIKYLGDNKYVTVNNVHTVIEAVKNPYYKNILNESLLALPDGKPLSIVAKLKGEKNIERIFGPSFMEKTLEWGQNNNIKNYFFGSSEETIKKMISNIQEKFPRTEIAGYYSPPYKEKFSEEENNLFTDSMNKSGADIIWIGLGAPKQELWMYENYTKLNHGVMIGIGAGFDYLAGNIKHAPTWMKNMSLEWLYRMKQEPQRLWKRYLITNSLFIFYIVLEYCGLKNNNK